MRESLGDLELIDDETLSNIHNWLDINIYKHGTQYNTGDLVKKVTGKDLDWMPFIEYIKSKFYSIYSIEY